MLERAAIDADTDIDTDIDTECDAFMSALVIASAPVFESTTKTVYILTRIADYVGTAVFLGGTVFVGALWPAGSRVASVRKVLLSAWVLAIGATAGAIGLEGAWINGTSVSTATHGAVLREVLATDFGREWGSKVLLWILAGVALADLLQRGETAARSLAWRVSTAAIGLGIVRVIGLTGHSHDTAHPVVAQVADLLHLGAMALWIGGLVMLLAGVLPARNRADLALVLPRYSLLALACVVTIVSSGLLMSWQLVGGFPALVHTTYGHLLLIKVVLLSAVMGAAYGSKNWVEHRLVFATVLRGDRLTVRPLVVSVATETVLVLLVLSAASFLVTASPGR